MKCYSSSWNVHTMALLWRNERSYNDDSWSRASAGESLHYYWFEIVHCCPIPFQHQLNFEKTSINDL